MHPQAASHWWYPALFAASALLLAPGAARAQHVAPRAVVPLSIVAGPAGPSRVVAGEGSSGRRWWWLPAGGALAGAVGFTAYYLSYCTDSDDGCMGVYVVPLWGAGLGAIAGGLVELGLRAGGAVTK